MEPFYPIIDPKILERVFSRFPQTRRYSYLAPLKLVHRPEQANKAERIFSINDYFGDAEIAEIAQKGLYRSFILMEWEIDIDHFLNVSSTQNDLFWTLAGRNMTTLTLNNCKIYYNLSLLPGPFWRKVPNLTSLTLLNCQLVIRREDGIEFKRHLKNLVAECQTQIEQHKSSEQNLIEELAAAPTKNFITKQIEALQSLQQELQDKVKDLRAQYRGSPDSKDYIYFKGLRYLCVQSTNKSSMPDDIDYETVMKIFPNLEKIFIRLEKARDRTPSVSECVSDRRILKELDVMRTETFLTKMPPLTMLTLPAESLTFDCGLEATAEKVGSVLESQAVNVKKLNVFRAPYAEPFSSIPCNRKMYLLNEFQLWGTVTSNLNFLKLMPFLLQFKWNTSCYDEETHGARLHEAFGQDGIHIMYANEIVQNTDELGDNFRLKSLSTFELECGALSLDSVKNLGKWLPNLKVLKVVITGEDELLEIGRQWPALEHLELVHGSYVAPETILHICLTYSIFQSLKSFTWKNCSCHTEEIGAIHVVAYCLLRKLVGETVILAWKGLYWKPLVNTCATTECMRDLYDKALTYGEEGAFNLRNFLNPSLQREDNERSDSPLE